MPIDNKADTLAQLLDDDTDLSGRDAYESGVTGNEGPVEKELKNNEMDKEHKKKETAPITFVPKNL